MSATEPSPTRADLARELLRYKMEDYSQNGFCASWLVDLEWELWEAAESSIPNDPRTMTIEASRECRALAEIAGGWWVWEDETVPAQMGPVFIPMTRWLEKWAHRKEKGA